MNEMNRREFLGKSAAVATAAALPIAACAQETMLTRLIPGTNEALPVIGFGQPEVFKKLGPEGKELPKALIQTMVDMGGRVMDTPAHFQFQPDPPVLGELLTEMGLQDELFLTSKITVEGKEEGIAHLEKALAVINKDPIDCLLIHNTHTLKWTDDHWPTLKDWKEAGRTRYIGVSMTRNTDYEELNKFMKDERPDFILTGYSVNNPMAEESCLPLAADLGIAVIIAEAFKAIEDGGIFAQVAGVDLPEWAAEFDAESWAQFALKYIVANPAVTCVVTETAKVKHVKDNMAGGYGRLPDASHLKRMRELIVSLQ